MIFVVVVLLILHAPDGHEVRISPEHVTALHAPKPSGENKLFANGVNCLISLADGKNISVVEPCTVVQRMLEGK